MTPALRIYHRRFWIGAMCILPVVFIAAVAVIPGRVSDPQAREMQPDALAIVQQEQQLEQFTIRLRTNTAGDLRQVELIINQPLEVPEALVYLAQQGDSDVLLGKLSSVGTYRFPLTSRFTQEPFILKISDPFKDANLLETSL